MNKCEFCNGDVVGYKCSRCGARPRKIAEEKPISKSEPTLPHRVVTATKAVVKHAMNRFVAVDRKTREKRLNICRSCDRFNDKNISCSECGCYLQIKTSWASEKCPLDKWGVEKVDPKRAAPRINNGCGGCGDKKT